jgi:hypothetical protein
MRRSLLAGAALALLGVLASVVGADEKKSGDRGQAPYAHVVVFRMKKDAPRDAVEKAITDCHELLSKIPSVRMVRAGRPAEKGTPDVPKMEYDFALLILVDDAAGLESYLKHPLHLKYVEKHGPSFDMAKLQVFDFLNQSK